MRAHGSIPAHTSADSLQAMVSQGFMRSIYTRAHPEGPRESTAKQQFLPPTDFTALWMSRWVGMLQRLAFWVCYAVLFFLTFFTTLAIVAMCFRVLDRAVDQLANYRREGVTPFADHSNRRERRAAVLASQRRWKKWSRKQMALRRKLAKQRAHVETKHGWLVGVLCQPAAIYVFLLLHRALTWWCSLLLRVDR